jgi:hypothetical protein
MSATGNRHWVATRKAPRTLVFVLSLPALLEIPPPRSQVSLCRVLAAQGRRRRRLHGGDCSGAEARLDRSSKMYLGGLMSAHASCRRAKVRQRRAQCFCPASVLLLSCWPAPCGSSGTYSIPLPKCQVATLQYAGLIWRRVTSVVT